MAFRDIIFNNLPLKLLSFVIATLTWLTIYGIQNDLRLSQNSASNQIEKTIPQHPITVMKSADDTRSFRVSPTQVEVTVRGRAERVQSLVPGEIEVFINLTDVYDTEGLIKAVQVFAPPGVTVMKVDPDRVRIERLRSE